MPPPHRKKPTIVPDTAVLVSEDRLREIMRETIRAEFVRVGIAADTDEAAVDAQKNQAFVKAWREAMQSGKMRAFLIVIGFVVTGLIVAALVGLGYPAAAKLLVNTTSN